MTDLTARITEILTEHVDRQLTNYDTEREECGCGKQGSASHDEHLAAVLAQAAEEHYRPRIETVEQLDGLPEFSIVGLQMPKRDNVSRHLYAIEKDCGWLGVASADDLSRTEIASMLAAEGPAVVLWSPGAGE